MASQVKEGEIIDSPEITSMDTEENHSEPRVYELSFHIDAEIPQEESKAVYQSIKDLIAKHATFIAEGEPEKIPLAYTISRMDTTGRRDFNSAFFAWIAYEAEGDAHAMILTALKENTKIIRFLDLRTTKEAALHAAEMHEFYRKAPEAPESVDDEVAPADTELDAALKEVGVE